MKFNARPIVTPAVTGLFVFVALSGIALFFHVKPGFFHEAHEWVGMAFAAFALWHVVRHWKSVTSYLASSPSISVILGSLVLASLLSFTTASPDGDNPKLVLRTLSQAPLETVAAALGQSPEQAVATLRAQGINAEAAMRVTEIAERAQVPPLRVLALLSPRPGRPD